MVFLLKSINIFLFFINNNFAPFNNPSALNGILTLLLYKEANWDIVTTLSGTDEDTIPSTVQLTLFLYIHHY